MLAPLRKYSADWKDHDVWKLPPAVLDIADTQICADAYIGSDPSHMQELECTDRLREIRRRDGRGGRSSSRSVTCPKPGTVQDASVSYEADQHPHLRPKPDIEAADIAAAASSILD
jgi:hypothetical protein